MGKVVLAEEVLQAYLNNKFYIISKVPTKICSLKLKNENLKELLFHVGW